MLIGGSNKLGLNPAPASRAGQKSSEKASSPFEDILGQASATTKEKPAADQAPSAAPRKFTDKLNSDAKEKYSFKDKTENKDQSESKTPNDRKNAEVQASSVDADGLPTTPTSPPQLSNPGIGERYVGQPLPNGATLNPLTKAAAITKGEDNVDSLTRRVVWNDFLRKMQDEFGVSAEEVMDAFASLSPEELAQPPEQSVDAVVMALGLPDQQAIMAKQYLQTLIDKTKPKSMGDELSASEKQISLTLMSQRDMQRKTLEQALEKMNQSFFMKAPGPVPAAANQMTPEQMQNALANTASTSEDVESFSKDDDGQSSAPLSIPGTALATDAAKDSGSAASPAPLTKAQAANAQLLKEMKPVAKEERASVDELIKKFLGPQAPSGMAQNQAMAAAAPAAMNTPAVPAAMSSAPGAAQSEMVSLNKLQSLLGGSGTLAGDDSEDEGEFTSDAAYLGGVNNDPTLQNLNLNPEEFRAQLADGPKPMEVPELVEQAQVMVRDGGGEMKVTLNPDGLGEVAMKVSVDNGRVNVQMITESDEAKKLIERQLSELKSQLHSNNLQLDNIKIDTATNLGKQLEQQYQDQQRQQAHQTLEQFRQDHQGWRQSFFEPPALRQYKGSSEAPRDTRAPTEPSARKAASHRRLDLVA